MSLSLREQKEQWFTLFDYLEDDIFDGVIGEDDTEAPMVQLRFYLTDTPIQRGSYENRKEETVTKTTVVNGVKTVTTTTTTSTSRGGQTTTTTSSSTRGTTSASKKSPVKSPVKASAHQTTTITTTSSEDADAYSVRRLTSDLRSGLSTLKEDLRAEQNDLHNYEDGRAETLAHLEKVHSELEKEHINDQVVGEELRRLDKDVVSEIGISTSQFEDQKDSLRRRIDHTDVQIKEVEPIAEAKKGERDQIQGVLDKDQQITASNLSQTAADLRKDNDGQRNKFQEAKGKVRSERDEKVKVFNQHADLVNTFNDLVMKYEKLLQDVEKSRKGAEGEKNQVDTELSTENSNGTNLEHFLNATNRDNGAHKSTAEALRKDLDALRQHYGKFETQLNGFVGTQSDEMKKLQEQLRKQEGEITKLQKNLSESANQIVELHATVDKENAANLNAKLSTLIQTLVDVDKYRRANQNRLENAQEGWSAKLRLFEDEASRMSRENANKKRADEIDNLLHKLDKLNRERNAIARERDEIEAKLLTDNNRDELTQKMEKELDGLNLKLTWANDEIVKTHGDLQDLLKFLEFKRNFLSEQEEQLASLRAEITEVKTKITECNTTIAELEEELRILNLRIEELQRLIAEKDDEIEELNRMLAERMKRIADLEAQLHVSSYIAVKGDTVDEMLAQYIKNCPVPVKRLGGGFYLFGLRKIYAKIMNGKLVIRVGGGYMVIEKFIDTYAEQELQKLMRVAEREGVSDISMLDLELIALGPKSPTGRSPTAKSPLGKSPTGSARTTFTSGMGSSINGTNRKTFKGSMKQVVRGTTTTTTTETVVTTKTMKK